MAHAIATRRLGEIEGLNPDILVSTCPFCEKNLGDSIIENGSAMKIMDIMELVDLRFEENTGA